MIFLACAHALCRAWKYDNAVMEYFVEDECKSLLKKSELLREVETTEKDARVPASNQYLKNI